MRRVGENYHRQFRAMVPILIVERSNVYVVRGASDGVTAELKWTMRGSPRLSKGPMSCTTSKQCV